MKIRNGFVSNSSSSSFILKLPFYPESYDDMRKILLGDNDPLVVCNYDDEAYPTKMIVDIIYRDVIKEIGPTKKKSIENINLSQELNIGEYSLDDYDDKIDKKYRIEYFELKKEFRKIQNEKDKMLRSSEMSQKDFSSRRKASEKYRDKLEIVADKMENIIIKSIKQTTVNTDIFITLSYSDNDGSMMSFIEHGNILDPITVANISHH
jgi:hypothetical protein